MSDASAPEQRTLGTDARPDPPRVRKQSSVSLGPRDVGFFGIEVQRERRVYVSEREADEHRYHGSDPWYDLPFSDDAHGLSLALFSRIAGSASLVYIVETDTGDVFEYAFSQFVDGAPINMNEDGTAAHPERGFEKDPQKLCRVEDAVWVYENEASRYRVPVR